MSRLRATDRAIGAVIRLAIDGREPGEIAAGAMVSIQTVNAVLKAVEGAFRGASEANSDAPAGACPVPAPEPAMPPLAAIAPPPSKPAVERKRTVPAARTDKPEVTKARSPAFPKGSPLAEKPVRERERPARPSQAERDADRQLIDAAIAAGKVTRLPDGHAAGLSSLEMAFHAAPLRADQRKGGWGSRAAEAGRAGRRKQGKAS